MRKRLELTSSGSQMLHILNISKSPGPVFCRQVLPKLEALQNNNHELRTANFGKDQTVGASSPSQAHNLEDNSSPTPKKDVSRDPF
jgi:hypothetical protein